MLLRYHIVQNDGYIHEAVSTQPWSGAAKVHVSIVNWMKQSPTEHCLDHQSVSSINSALTATIDVSVAKRLNVNLNQCFQGVIPVGKGFIVTEQQVDSWSKANPKNYDVLKLSSMGANLAQNPQGKPERWIIDFNKLSLEDASEYELPFRHVEVYVKPERDQNRMESRRLKWWQPGGNPQQMRFRCSHI